MRSSRTPSLLFARALSAALVAWALAAWAVGCDEKPGAELGEAACSNGVDDDGDGLVDCADPSCRLFAWCAVTEPDAARPSVDAGDATVGDATLACDAALDLVLVLDVSSSMTSDVGRVAELAEPLFAAAQAASRDAHVSLVVFVDDALAVDGCAPFADASALRASLEGWRAFTATNRSPVSNLENVDCAENSLDALAVAFTTCGWRGGTRVILHITDDTFAERPAVLSGPYGPGVVVTSTYPEVAAALVRADIHVLAATARGEGASCGGARVSPDVGRGFADPYDGAASLPEQTGGRWWPLAGFRDGSVALDTELATFLSSAVCAP